MNGAVAMLFAALTLAASAPAFAESAYEIRMGDLATARDCFAVASARFEYDMVQPSAYAGRQAPENQAYWRRVMLGWEKALMAAYKTDPDLSMDYLMEDGAKLAAAVAEATAGVVPAAQKHESTPRLDRCLGYITGATVPAMLPFELGVVPLKPEANDLTYDEVRTCVGIGETLRQSSGPAGGLYTSGYYKMLQDRLAAVGRQTEFDVVVSGAYAEVHAKILAGAKLPGGTTVAMNQLSQPCRALIR